MKKLFTKIRAWYSVLPDKKRHIELITAALSVPMMLTIILVNINNINIAKAKPVETTPAPIQVIIDNPQNSTTSPTQTVAIPTTKNTGTITPTATPTVVACNKDIGPVSISSPLEGEIVTDDKVNIIISTDSKYCLVTWSYRLDSGSWSDFSNNNISLYNLPAGKKQIQIKIKNAAGDKTITLERNFIYQNSAAPTITPTPTVTPSVTVTP